MSAKGAYKPTPVETAAHIATVQAAEAALRTANPKKNVARPADPYVGGESFDYAT